MAQQLHMTKGMLQAEARLGQPLGQILVETYYRLGTYEAVAKELRERLGHHVPVSTISFWMDCLGLKRKPKPQRVSRETSQGAMPEVVDTITVKDLASPDDFMAYVVQSIRFGEEINEAR